MEKRVWEIICKYMEREREDNNIPFDVTLKELGVNSVNYIKIIVELETEFDIEFEDNEIAGDKEYTVRELKEIIEERQQR